LVEDPHVVVYIIISCCLSSGLLELLVYDMTFGGGAFLWTSSILTNGLTFFGSFFYMLLTTRFKTSLL